MHGAQLRKTGCRLSCFAHKIIRRMERLYPLSMLNSWVYHSTLTEDDLFDKAKVEEWMSGLAEPFK